MPTLKGYSINERVIQTLANQGYDLDDLKQLRLHFLGRSFDSEISLKDEIRNRFGVDFNRSLVLRCVELSQRMSIYRIHWFIKDFFLPQSFFVPSAWDWLMVSPFVLFFRMRSRFLCSSLKRRFTGSSSRHLGEVNKSGFEHNYKQIIDFSIGHRKRTERLIMAMKCIEDFPYQNRRVLVVGPRNEGEIMLLKAHGYSNTVAIDLFSYSSMIEEMNMNNTSFRDNEFDVYYSSAVIKYSPDIKKTVAEAVRVTKNGGLMVFGFTFGAETDIVPNGSHLKGGVKELLSLFDGHVRSVCFCDEFLIGDGDTRAAVVFRLDK